MALRLRRDVQKSSYYLWFLGAEEARGLRGPRVINPVLPYLIDRSNEQEPIKVTLQISHKGIKILQGSSKHFIPHSAITSSVQTDDIVACVLLLYNPATKCPLHVHAYRCDSETTAETLHQQLQTLINRPENQKRFEELESRLGVSQANLANLTKVVETKHQAPRRFESSPKRFESSLGSDTGHSTRESECSEEHNVSPMGLAPPALKQNAELFDSLAAELRAKLNGNGPPLLLPPRDYDTVHRSKGNLAAIELRRCRNSLIVGGPTSTTTVQPTAVKQVSSRGSSGIGSDLAPSPERQDTHSSSEDEHWSNEADNSVIALKASQIAIEKKQPLSRKSAMQPPSDNYLRDLPAKPYKSLTRDKDKPIKQNSSWTSKEEEIRPIIMRPSDYDAKFKRILMEKHHDEDAGINKGRHQSNRVKEIGYQLENEHFRKYPDDIRENVRDNIREKVRQRQSAEQSPEIVKYNQMEKIFQKKLSLERETSYKMHSCDDFDSDHETGNYRKENLTDKQKFQEFSTKVDKPITDHQKFGRQRYADPKDLPFESVKNSQSYKPGYSCSPDPNRDQAEHERKRSKERNRERSRVRGDGRDPSYSHSNERNPYREPDSIPYMESIEKMMKSPVMRYKSFEEEARDAEIIPRTNLRKSHSKTSDEYEVEREFAYNRKQRSYPEPTVVLAKDRFKDAKEKFRAMERSRYSPEDVEPSPPMPPRRRTSLEPIENEIRYDDWSDDEPIASRSSRDQRDIRPARSNREPRDLRDVHDPRDMVRDPRGYRDIRDTRNSREMLEIDSRDVRETRERDPRDMRDPRDIRDIRGEPRDYRDGGNRNIRDPREHRDAHEFRETREVRDYRQTDKRQDAIYPPITNSKSLSNLAKGYRHSYAEPALARSGGRVGLAAVNPF